MSMNDDGERIAAAAASCNQFMNSNSVTGDFDQRHQNGLVLVGAPEQINMYATQS